MHVLIDVGHGSRGVLAGRTGPSDMLAPTAETRRELSTAADDCVSSRVGVSWATVDTTAAGAQQRTRRLLSVCSPSSTVGHRPQGIAIAGGVMWVTVRS
jgi:hypothetical protein